MVHPVERKICLVGLLLCLWFRLRVTGALSIKENSKSKDASKGQIWSSPVVQVYEGENDTLWQSTDEDNRIVIAEGLQKIRLVCVAFYPVRWKLEGLTGFDFIGGSASYVNKSTNGKEYQEDLIIGHLAEPYTGRYVCDSKEFPDRRSSIFIFVPGNDIFVNSRGKNIYFSGNEAPEIKTTIPCGVSHPSVFVTLLQSNEDSTEVVNVTMNATYAPETGFILKSQAAPGKYFCVANLNQGITKVVEYNFIRDNGPINSTRCNKYCEENTRCKSDSNGYEFCECNPSFFPAFEIDLFGFECLRKCKSDEDCPSNMSCQPRKHSHLESWSSTQVQEEYRNVCRNPCIYLQVGVDCYENSGNGTCKVQDHLAIC